MLTGDRAKLDDRHNAHRYQLRTNDHLEPGSIICVSAGIAVRIAACLIDDLPEDISEDLKLEDVGR